ncbi:MAG: hypothetical protein F6K11_29250 [Leptolyngbya sp. SIO3F4]|nr:hypothetical protein [Leptolyngbya sp. SIO3F4]
MLFSRCLALSSLIVPLTLGTISSLTLGGGQPVWAQTDLNSQADQLLNEGIQLYQVSQWRQALDNYQQALALYRQARYISS